MSDDILRIYKYEFEIADRVVIQLPIGHKILKVDRQAGQDSTSACLWAVVDPVSRLMRFSFRIFGTGHPMEPGTYGDHVGSWLATPFVWHMFRGTP